MFGQFFPQIEIAIGVLTSNRGEGDEPFWQIGRGTRVPLQGGVDVVPLQGAIVVCHGWRGKVTTNFRGVDVVPLLGAIVMCHCSVLWLVGEGDDQLLGSGRGAMCFISSFYIQGHQFHPDTKENNKEFCVGLLADVTLFSTLLKQKIGFCYLGSMLV